LDLLKPLKPTAAVAEAYTVIRKDVPFADKDRVFSKDINAIREMIVNHKLDSVLKGLEF
jgi:histidine ammonia-lyase